MAKKLTYAQIIILQRYYGVTETQDSINSGQCWLMEGSQGRFAMNMLEAGVCMLPLVPRRDYYGNTVPPRNVIKSGATGSFANSQNFWQKVEDGNYEVIEGLEETFGCVSQNEVA